MKTTSASLLATAAAAVSAQSTQTGPFKLRLSDAANSTLNGAYLSSCHAGAAVESLCYSTDGSRSGDMYYFNTTQGGEDGTLVWDMPFSNSDNNTESYIPSSMQLGFDPSSSVAVTMLYPGDRATPVGFDADGKLFITASFDESTFKPADRPGFASRPLYQWEACWAHAGSYYYPVVAWNLGGGAHPRNPTCTHVNVTKVAV